MAEESLESDGGIDSLLNTLNPDAPPEVDTEVMDLLPADGELGPLEPVYGPHLPGLEAGNCSETVHNNSPRPSSFMVDDEPTSVIFKEVKDASAKPGECGLHNMGNTCFMNSGLQCLMNNPYLCQYMLHNANFSEGSLMGQFSSLLRKLWLGEYSILHPSEFKETLGLVHGQFKDFRQHDGQEFLALMLDTLHEELNDRNRRAKKESSPATDISDESDDSHYASEASSSKLSELETLDLDSNKDEPINNQNVMCKEDSKDLGATGGIVKNANGDISSENVRLPSIAEFYLKDVKTLNTNMLQEKESTVTLATGSNKFPKTEKGKKKNLGNGDCKTLINRTENALQGACHRSPPKNKKTNVIAARKSRSSSCPNNLSVKTNDLKNVNECCSSADESDSIKRMKMDSVIDPIVASKPSNISPINFHNYAVPSPVGPQSSLDVDGDQLGLAKLSHKLSQELQNNDLTCAFITSGSGKSNNLSSKVTIKNIVEISSSLSPSSLDGPECKSSFKKGASCQSESVIPNNKVHLNEMLARGKKASTDVAIVDEGDRMWRDYLRRNDTIIVDNFHGQLKSTVVCSNCGHVSVIYEPFMYLSVPLPRAMEKKLVVTWVPIHSQTPCRYLVKLNRLDTVTELRMEVLSAVFGEDSGKEIVLAEALDHHISRILEDGLQLRYVNDNFRILYAFEVESKPTLPNSGIDNSSGFGSFGVSNSQSFEMNDHCSISSTTDFNFGQSCYTDQGLDWDILGSAEVTTSSATTVDGDVGKISESLHTIEQDSTVDSSTKSDIFSNMQQFNSSEFQESIGKYVESCQSSYNDSQASTEAVQSDSVGADLWYNSTPSCSEPTSSYTNNEGWDKSGDKEAKATSLDKGEVGYREEGVKEEGIGSSKDWHSCVICLEELPPDQLLKHPVCEAMLCSLCINRTIKHYGNDIINCPVCRREINPNTDYVPLVKSANVHRIRRLLLLPVLFRDDWWENGIRKMALFGHPNVLYTLNEVSGEELFSRLESMMAVPSDFSVSLTDGQGLHCSRCSYELQCSGCQLAREVDVSLTCDDHLTITFLNLPLNTMEEANASCDDQSLCEMTCSDPITLQECFQAFTEREELDENNPWFCPECKKHQRAEKTIAIQKFPNTLIVYLKRFVFHQLMSTKLENKVLFPIESLDLSEFLNSAEPAEYNLQSSVCHFGGVNAGHYTSYVKNPISRKWLYCNDETVIEKNPSEEDAESVYILFYQRDDPDVSFELPKPLKAAVSESMQIEYAGSPSPHLPSSNDDYVNQYVKQNNVLSDDMNICSSSDGLCELD